jgi:alkylation response protein AidB-like acyl-CoA dehydrogenase
MHQEHRMRCGQALADVVKVARDNAQRVDAEAVFPAQAVAELRAGGLLGLVLPEDVGGFGVGPVEFVDVVTEIAAACGSTAMIYLMHAAAAATVAAAPPAGLPGLLGDLASGRALGTLAFSERGSRSHFWAAVSKAAVAGDRVRPRAQKSFVTSAGYADVYVVSTRSPGGPAGEVDLYAVPAGAAGLTAQGVWRGMGLRGNASAPMTVDVSVPAGYRLGEPGAGFGLMMQTVLPWFNLGNAAVSVGLATAATDAATRHVAQTTLEHLGQSLRDLPTIRAATARMGITLATQRAYLRQAAASVAASNDATMLHVLGVKAAANDAALEITEAAMRVCGGAAFSSTLPIERSFRDARAGSVMAPTADVLYDFYGKAVTGLPLF